MKMKKTGRIMKNIAIIAIILTAITSAVFAQNDKCVQYGWVEDKELQKDIFIHETPSPTGKSLGEIPYDLEEDDQAMVEIIGYSKGWLKIRKAETVAGKVLFEGSGWITAKRVTANAQRLDGNNRKGLALYSKPTKSSKKVGTIPGETLIEIVGYDCFGLKVKYKGKTGWLSARDICGNPVTTCP